MGTSIKRQLSTRCCAFPVFVVSTLLYLISFALPASASSGLAEYEKPWEICALCHSLDGNSRMAKFPRLAGQPRLYIEKQLRDFLTGSRLNGGGQMSSIVTEVAEEDFQAIAIWFSSQEPPVPNELGSRNRNTGQSTFLESGCIECHRAGIKNDEDTLVPILASQHAQYLRKQLYDFQEGNRIHIPALITTDPVLELTESDIDALVDYLAATARE